MMILLNMIACVVVGVLLGREWTRIKIEVAKGDHVKEMKELTDEIKRLRAQVAQHIGSDNASSK